jgi:hypothetical protein
MTTPGHLYNCPCPYCTDQFSGLGAGITVEDIIESFTTPGKQFQFPIEGIPVKLTKETSNTLLLSAGIIGLGIFLGLAMSRNQDKKGAH